VLRITPAISRFSGKHGAVDVSGSAIDSSFVPPPTSPRLRILDDVGHRCCQKLSEWLPFQRPNKTNEFVTVAVQADGVHVPTTSTIAAAMGRGGAGKKMALRFRSANVKQKSSESVRPSAKESESTFLATIRTAMQGKATGCCRHFHEMGTTK